MSDKKHPTIELEQNAPPEGTTRQDPPNSNLVIDPYMGVGCVISRLQFILDGLRDSDPADDGDQEHWVDVATSFLPWAIGDLKDVLQDLNKAFDVEAQQGDSPVVARLLKQIGLYPQESGVTHG